MKFLDYTAYKAITFVCQIAFTNYVHILRIALNVNIARVICRAISRAHVVHVMLQIILEDFYIITLNRTYFHLTLVWTDSKRREHDTKKYRVAIQAITYHIF